jgi:hypothetical protein
VADFSPETFRSVVAHLEVSTAFEHFVFREAELGALWSLTGFELACKPDPEKREAVMRLRDAILQAHDLLGRKRRLKQSRACSPSPDSAGQIESLNRSPAGSAHFYGMCVRRPSGGRKKTTITAQSTSIASASVLIRE